MRPERPGLRPEKPYLMPKRPGLRPNRLDLRPERPDSRSQRPDLGLEGPNGGGRTNARTDERKSPYVLQDFVPFGAAAQKKERNRSPKGNMWPAIPVALLCMIVNWSKRKQGSGPKGDNVL